MKKIIIKTAHEKMSNDDDYYYLFFGSRLEKKYTLLHVASQYLYLFDKMILNSVSTLSRTLLSFQHMIALCSSLMHAK